VKARRSPALWLLALLLIVAAVDAPTLRGGFVWDDTVLVLKNQLTGDPSNLPAFFQIDLWSSVSAEEGGTRTPFYRPMMLASLALDRALFGLSPAGAHLHSLLWHLLTTALVWRLLRGLVHDAPAATAGAALFALHPMHLELVAFVAARNDAMAAAGVLGALILLEPARAGPGRLLGAGLCALFALLSKESAALVVGLLLAVDQARYGRPGGLGRYGALLAAVGVWLGLRSRAALEPAGASRLFEALAGSPAALAHYAEALLRPTAFEPAVYLQAQDPDWGWLALGALVFAGLVLAARRERGASGETSGETLGRTALAGLGIAGLTFAPALLGIQRSGLYSHRYAYLPMVGLVLVVAAALSGRDRRWSAGAALVAAALALCSARAAPVWSSTEDFWAHNHARNPSPLTACPLFVEYALADEPALAEPLLREALAGPVTEHCCFWASRFYFDRGRPELARASGEQALAAGCPASPELIAPLAMSEALACEWDRAEARMSTLPGDPYGYRALLLSAAALRRGDASVMEGFAGDPREAEDGGALRVHVEFLLDQSGCD